jgi:hypothetical protein
LLAWYRCVDQVSVSNDATGVTEPDSDISRFETAAVTPKKPFAGVFVARSRLHGARFRFGRFSSEQDVQRPTHDALRSPSEDLFSFPAPRIDATVHVGGERGDHHNGIGGTIARRIAHVNHSAVRETIVDLLG